MKKTSLALAAALAALPSLASAQTLEIGSADSGRDRYESPQHFALEVRFSPWRPDVDGEFNGRTPFLDYFGEADASASGGRSVSYRLLGALEFDWQALRINPLGTLGVGVSVGYSSLSANAPLTSGGGASGQSSALNVLPGYAVGVFRLDVLARRTVIPVVFYGKAGIAATYWWVTSGDTLARRNAQSPAAPDNASDLGQAATGISYGWQLAAGLMLRLDWLEPRAQRAWDVEMGVNHSYLFAEFMRVSDWTSRPQLHLGSSTWTFGLAFEF